MYKANLSYAQLKHYLAFLVNKNLLEKVGKRYVATPKGKEYVKAYNKLKLSYLEEKQKPFFY